ncbi:MAG TPA: hypothetical protein VF211_04315 [Burkholderiales bacterium]
MWDGRFRSCLVESREYVLACHRYTERDPVRAGMVACPSAYRWSSFKANSGEAEAAFVSALREATDGGLPMVGQALRSRLEAMGWRVEKGKPGRRSAPTPDTAPLNAEPQFSARRELRP